MARIAVEKKAAEQERKELQANFDQHQQLQKQQQEQVRKVKEEYLNSFCRCCHASWIIRAEFILTNDSQVSLDPVINTNNMSTCTCTWRSVFSQRGICTNVHLKNKQCSFPLQENLSYQDDLLKQMDYQQKVKEVDVQQNKKELELNKEAERLYQQRVQAAISRPHPDKVHPRRLLKEHS